MLSRRLPGVVRARRQWLTVAVAALVALGTVTTASVLPVSGAQAKGLHFGGGSSSEPSPGADGTSSSKGGSESGGSGGGGGGVLGTVKGVGCGLASSIPIIGGVVSNVGPCSSSGGGGGGFSLGSLVGLLPKLIPAFLGGIIGWFLGATALHALLGGVFKFLLWTPYTSITSTCGLTLGAPHVSSSTAAAACGSPAGTLEAQLTVIALGGLTSIVLMSALWHWIAGMFDLHGGSEALTALTRGIGAAVALPAWVFAAPLLVRAGDGLTSSINGLATNSGGAAGLLGGLLGFSSGAGAAGLFGDIGKVKGFGLGFVLVLLAVLVLLLLLFALKVAITTAGLLIFAAFPLALMVWPVRRLGWIAEALLGAFVVLLMIPVGWAVILAAMSAVLGAFATFDTSGMSLIAYLLQPFEAIVLLWMLVALPRQMIHLALFQTIARRPVIGEITHRTVTNAGTTALQGYLPERFGGPGSPGAGAEANGSAHTTTLTGVGTPSERPALDQAARFGLDDTFASRPPDRAGGPAASSAPDRGADTFASTASDRGAELVSRDHTHRTAGGVLTGDADGFTGMPTNDLQQVEDRVRVAREERTRKEPSAGRLAAALASMPPEVAASVAHAHQRLGNPTAFTRQMARQASSESYSPETRAALQAFAAGSPDERRSAIQSAREEFESSSPQHAQAIDRALSHSEEGALR